MNRTFHRSVYGRRHVGVGAEEPPTPERAILAIGIGATVIAALTGHYIIAGGVAVATAFGSKILPLSTFVP